MSSDSKSIDWNLFHYTLRNQLKPYGFCGHALLNSFATKKTHLEDMIKRTALLGESNSVLIIGPRGSGKSALLECVINDAFENQQIAENMLYVGLDGLIHTDDNIALEDITDQLKFKTVDQRPHESFSEKLRLLLGALKTGSKQSKSIIFVLDNFDLFCTHKNQTLLYNLFDVAQSKQSPISVIGMSCRPDVLQVLENRVNSRFSHQKIYLFDELSFSEYLEAAKICLSLPNCSFDRKTCKQWNASVTNILEQKSVTELLKVHYNFSTSLRNLKELLLLSIVRLGPSHSKLEEKDFLEASKHCDEDFKPCILNGLSVLEVALVIGMMHLTVIYDGEPFNFEMVCHELKKFFKKKMIWNLEKSVVMKAFEHLLDLEIIKTCGSSSNVQKRYMLVRLLVEVNEVKEAIEQYQNLPVQLKQWSLSSIAE